MLKNKTYTCLEISVIKIEEADVITTSGIVAVSWGGAWGNNWDDYDVKEVWQ